ncbi:hypothetical protein [Cerasicoccus maritimus]|uniref:hypothetical protein n=1 Tax=Cerasicoccus maritimus TaxID=490089 RepID=UPI002852A905|nr:hypothetical protein [Cerasicoccus maritimus]
MSGELAYIARLQQAYRNGASREELAAAFAAIKDLDPESQRQFADFMEVVAASAECSAALSVNDNEVAKIDLHARDAAIDLTEPGHYTLTLSTGRVIWKQHLDAKELFLVDHDTLPVAADTDDAQDRVSFETTLLDGEIILSLTPGLHQGTLRIQWQAG